MSHKGKPQFSSQEPSQKSEHKFKTTEAGYYNRHPEFSYKYYEHTHRKYSAKCIGIIDDFHTLFERLQKMSQLKWKQIKEASQMYHFHPIEWHRSSEQNGFKHLPPELREFPPFQFKLFKECRAIGFFNQNNIFELVWLDRFHKVCPRD